MKTFWLRLVRGYLGAQHYLLSHTDINDSALEQARRAVTEADRALDVLSIQ